MLLINFNIEINLLILLYQRIYFTFLFKILNRKEIKFTYVLIYFYKIPHNLHQLRPMKLHSWRWPVFYEVYEHIFKHVMTVVMGTFLQKDMNIL